MKIIDLHNELNQLEIMAPDEYTADGNGSAIDLQGYQGKLKVMLHSQAGGGTTPTMDCKIQDSEDGSTGWADVSGAAFTQVTDAAASQQSLSIDTRGVKRYIRNARAITGTSPTFKSAIIAVGQKQIM